MIILVIVRMDDSGLEEQPSGKYSPRKFYLPTLPLVECSAEGNRLGPTLVTTKDESSRLRQQINPIQQLILEEANRVAN